MHGPLFPRWFGVVPEVRAGDESCGTVVASGARAGHEEPDAVVPTKLVGGDGRVVDMADNVIPVERLRGSTGSDFEHGSVVELGLAKAVLLFIADLVLRDGVTSVILSLLVALQLDQIRRGKVDVAASRGI